MVDSRNRSRAAKASAGIASIKHGKQCRCSFWSCAMKGISNSHHPHASDQASLSSGQILRAHIKKTYLDHCDLDLLAFEDDRVLAHGRLYQAERLAWKDERCWRYPDYQQGEILKAEFVNLRHEDG